jgi:hypothetical protein
MLRVLNSASRITRPTASVIFGFLVERLVLFLASDDSSAITNQSYMIDAVWV